jgi:hypothetical protein
MKKYKHSNGQTYTESQLLEWAQSEGMTLDEYFAQYGHHFKDVALGSDEHADIDGFLDAASSVFRAEENVVPYLNEYYKDKKFNGKSVRFSQAQPWRDTFEVFIGEWVVGENGEMEWVGEEFVTDKGSGTQFNLDWRRHDNRDVFNNMTKYIDEATQSINESEDWQEIESELTRIFEPKLVTQTAASRGASGDNFYYTQEETATQELTTLLSEKGFEVKESGKLGNEIIITTPGNVEGKFDLDKLTRLHDYYLDKGINKNPYQKIFDFIKRNPTKDPEILEQEKEFINFLSNPAIISERGGILPPSESNQPWGSIGEQDIYGGGIFSPENMKIITGDEFLRGIATSDEFIKKLRDEFGYSFWWDDSENNENRMRFPKLSKERMEELVTETFNNLVYIERSKYLNGLATDQISDIENAIESEGYYEFMGEKVTTFAEFFEVYRNDFISTFADENERLLAEANMILMYDKTLTEEDRNRYILQRDEAIAAMDNYIPLINYETGMRINVPENQLEIYESQGYTSNKTNVDLALAEIESNILSYKENNSDKSEFEIIEDAVEENTLQIIRMQDYLDTEYTFWQRKYIGGSQPSLQSYKETAQVEEGPYKKWGTEKVTLTLREAIRLSKHSDHELYPAEDIPLFQKPNGDVININPNLGHPDFEVDNLTGNDITGSMKGPKYIYKGRDEGSVVKELNKKHWTQFAEVVQTDLNYLLDKQEAYKTLFYLNEDITSIGDKQEGYFGGSSTLWGNFGVQTVSGIIGGENYKRMFGMSEMDKIDNAANELTNLGFKLTPDQKNYQYRGLGQTVMEGFGGSIGILLEFAVANKATAALKATKLLGKGKTLKTVLDTYKGNRYKNSYRVLSQPQIEKLAAFKNMTVPEYAAQWGMKSIGPNRIQYGAAMFTESLIEGTKFWAIGGEGVFGGVGGSREFFTGFGFGLAGQIFAPIFGTITESTFTASKILKAANVPKTTKWLANQSSKLNKIYELGFKNPTNFVIGSEIGELANAISQEAFLNLPGWSHYMEEHWGEYSEPSKRLMSNFIIGIGFGFTHKATYGKRIGGKFQWFPDFRTIESMKNAKKEAWNKMYNWDTRYEVKDKKGNIVKLTKEQMSKKALDRGWRIVKGPGWKINNKLSKEEFQKHEDTFSVFDSMYKRAKGLLELKDPIRGREKLDKAYRKQLKYYEEAGWKVHIEWGTNKTMKSKAYEESIVNKDGKPTKHIRIKYNVDQVSLGLAPHEMGHSGMKVLFGENARLKADFLNDLWRVAKEIEIDQIHTEGPRKGEYMSLAAALKLKNGKWDLAASPWENARISEWELFSHIAERLADPANLVKLKASNAFGKFKNLLNETIGNELGQKYDLKLESDIVRFFGDYIESINKGANSLKVLKHLKDVIIDPKDLGKEELAMWEAEGFSFTRQGTAKATTLESSELIQKNKKLLSEHYKDGKWTNKSKKVEFEKNVEKIKKQKSLIEKVVKKESGELGYKEGRSNSEIKNENSRIVETVIELLRQSKVNRIKDLPRGEIKDAIITNLLNNNIGVINKLAGKAEQTALKDKNVPKDQIPSNKSFVQEYTLEALKLINNYNPKLNPEFGAYLQNKKTGLPVKYGAVLKSLLKGQTKHKADVDKADVETKAEYQKDFEIGKGDRVKAEDGIVLINEFFRSKEIETKLLEEGLAKDPNFKIKTEQTIDIKKRDMVVKEIESVIEKLSPKELVNIDFVNIREFHKKFGGEKPHEIYTAISKRISDIITGKGYSNKVNFLGEKWSGFYKSEPPNNVVRMSGVKTQKGVKGGEGRSIELRNRILNMDYKRSGKRTTDDATGASIEVWNKVKNMTQKEWLAKRHIEMVDVPVPRPEGGFNIEVQYKLKKNISASKKLDIDVTLQEGYRSLVDQVLVRWMEKNYSKNPKLMTMMSEGQIIAKYTAGRSPRLASDRLGNQTFKNQDFFYKEINSERFGRILHYYRSKFDSEKGVIEAIKEHFTFLSGKHTISKDDLAQIGKDFAKEFKFAPKITQEMITQKAIKSIEFTTNLDVIDGKANVEKYVNEKAWKSVDRIIDLQLASRKITKEIIKKHGPEAYEAMLSAGESGGGGFGYARSIGDLVVGKYHKNRYSIWESIEMTRDMVKDIVAELKAEGFKLKKYKGFKKPESDLQGIKGSETTKGVFVEIGGLSTKWNQKAINKSNKIAEYNKTILKDASKIIRELYKKGEINNIQARMWVEMHFANMTGLGKKSASLALVPNMTPAQMRATWGGKAKDYVLEHTTPAQYVKARMYDYIINGGKNKKNAFDLTIRDYHTTFIPKGLDIMVNKVFKTNLPSAHLPGMDPISARYYEAFYSSDFNFGLKNVMFGKNNLQKTYDHHPNLNFKQKQEKIQEIGLQYQQIFQKLGLSKGTSKRLNSENLDNLRSIHDALSKGKVSKKKRGMSTWDFDDTLAKTKSKIKFTRPDGTKGKLNAEQYAKDYVKLAEQGYKFDFSEFNLVVEPTIGPFFKKFKERVKKFGPEHNYILTARPPESAKAIYEFLKSQGVNIPLENIKGLGNSTGEAKALWMLKKFSEGYNDMYFADDALANVKAVRDVLSQLDVKSKVQQARRLNSDNMSSDFNKILEETKGVGAEKTYSEIQAKMKGKRTINWRTPGAEDFSGLVTYAFAGKGKKGEAHKKFFDENLQKPFNRAYEEIHAMKQTISGDYKALRNEFKEVRKDLNVKLKDFEGKWGEGSTGEFTVDNALRVYLWNKAGYEVPGISKKDARILSDFVTKDANLVAFAENLRAITKLKEGYIKPSKHWLGENITMDMNNVVEKVYRKEFLTEFVQNREKIFGKWDNGRIIGSNMNKIEALYGSRHREALENILWRMEKGTNRTVGKDSNVNRWMNWMNNATGTIMFFNQKSAALQTISSLNYVNGTFNNPLRAAQAFANQPQYWKDFAKIWNSDMMLQRRAGLKINVEASEMIERIGDGKNAAERALAYLLEKGFIPTKYADSFAIASGGASFYRNSIRKYKKQGLSIKEAEARAWEDLMFMTEATQQSSRPDLISMQQASALGRPILAFANTPMQMLRRHKRRIQDIANQRGNTAENVLSALYYGFAQTMVFSFLQNAMFAVDDESEDPKDIKHAEKQKTRYVNTIMDSYLRGWGTGGATISALKNGIVSFVKESEKDYKADYGNTIIELLNVSPPVGSKARKLYSSFKTYKYNKEVIGEMGMDIDNPAVLAVANVVSAVTNVPTDRAVMKVNNIRDAAYGDFETWQRLAMLMGWNKWVLGVEGGPGLEKVEKTKSDIKLKKKMEKYGVETEQEVLNIEKGKEVRKLNKKQQQRVLTAIGLESWEVLELRKEQDRIDAVIKYWNNNPEKIDSILTLPTDSLPEFIQRTSITY